MAFYSTTLQASANLDDSPLDAALNWIVDKAVESGWTLLSRQQHIPDGQRAPHAGRVSHASPRFHWRIEVIGNNTTRAGFRDLRFYDFEGNLIDLTGVEVLTSSYHIYDGHNAVDGDTATYWQTYDATVESAWISFNFTNASAGAVSIGRVDALPHEAFTGTTGYSVQWSPDGVTWLAAYEARMPADGGEGDWFFDASGAPFDGSTYWQSNHDYYGNSSQYNRPLRTHGERVYLRGPGGGSGREVYVCLATLRNTNTLHYNLEVRTMTGFDTTLGPDYQPGVSTWFKRVPFSQDDVEAHLYISDRRIIGQFGHGSVWNGFYAGFFVPFALPSEYPFPLIEIGSTDDTTTPHDSARTEYRNFFDTGWNCGHMRDWDGLWHNFGHHDEGSAVNNPRQASFTRIWPWSLGGTNGSSTFPSTYEGDCDSFATGSWLEFCDRNAQGELPIFPAHVVAQSSLTGMVGALEGVFCIPGADLVAGQVVTIGARNFRAFPNCNRRQGNHWALIEEI